MENQRTPLERTGLLPPLVQDLLKDADRVHPYRAFHPGPDGYAKAIETREFGDREREQLVEGLKAQYQRDGVDPRGPVADRIEALKDRKTYTVTTGHQLCLFSGPLLSIHKTLHTIRLAEELQKKHPEHRFVPVHWMASEDHDREEIDHSIIDGETFRWETDQKGAVGRMEPRGVDELVQEVVQKIEGLPYAQEWSELLHECYSRSGNWAQATRKLLNALFGEQGLVIIDGDDVSFKSAFLQDMREEFTRGRSAECVERTDEALQKSGYELQVHPRAINLFYLGEGYRERIEGTEDGFRTADGKKAWKKEEILEELEADPARFSPNVILRPLYQERILPNVAYVGGQAEIAYWHQLKGLFEEADAFFPVLQLRSQLFHVDKKSAELMERSDMKMEDLFKDRDVAIREHVKGKSEQDLQLEREEEQFRELYETIAQKASSIDPNLWDSVMAERRKAEKGLERIRSKMVRHAKKHEKALVESIERVYEGLFPGGKPQERTENITPFYGREGKQFLHRLAKEVDPFRAEAILIVEKEA